MAKIYFKTLIFILNPSPAAMPAWPNDAFYTPAAADLVAAVKRFEPSTYTEMWNFFTHFFSPCLMCFFWWCFSPDRGRPSGGKVRHKRQALQDMARPLKQWLYKHRDNPYPTKTEKILLALGSQMTLVQVSPTQPPDAKRRMESWECSVQSMR